MFKKNILLLFSLFLVICSCSKKKNNFDINIDKNSDINDINHVVVIYMENHSFDNLYGQFEGANGLTDAPDSQITQIDSTGQPYKTLPDIPRSSAFPTNLPNTYFNIDQYLSSRKAEPSPIHEYYHEIMQIDSGKMDKFVLHGTNGGIVMGYYKTKDLPLYDIAKKYTLCDNFFHSGYGSSYFNHVFLIAARPARWKDAPDNMRAKVDSSGKMIKDGLITPDGYVLNTVYSKGSVYPSGTDSSRLMPNQTFPTIGDRLNKKDISWAWYSQGWDEAVDSSSSVFAYNHEPFMLFANYAKGTEGRKKHLKDEDDFLKAAKEGALPAVSFVKPGRGYDQHPGSGSVYKGGMHALKLINAVRNSPDWDSTMVILTYDENGGFWDHVPPPVKDRWGPGTRIPAIIISPYAKKGYVDHTQYETVSILAFIEKRWNLKPLTDRDRNANPLQNAFVFSNKGHKQN